jgi:hypothetical protein
MTSGQLTPEPGAPLWFSDVFVEEFFDPGPEVEAALRQNFLPWNIARPVPDVALRPEGTKKLPSFPFGRVAVLGRQ